MGTEYRVLNIENRTLNTDYAPTLPTLTTDNETRHVAQSFCRQAFRSWIGDLHQSRKNARRCISRRTMTRNPGGRNEEVGQIVPKWDKTVFRRGKPQPVKRGFVPHGAENIANTKENSAKPAKKKKNHEGHESHESAADSGMGLGSTAHAPHASERISRKDAEAQSKKNERDTDGQTHVLLCACVLA